MKGLCSVCSLLSVGWLSEGDGVPMRSSVRDGDGDQTTTTSGLLPLVLPLSGWSLTSVLPLGGSLGLLGSVGLLLSQLPASTGSLGWSPSGGGPPGGSGPPGSWPPGGGPPSGRPPASTESTTSASHSSLLLFVGGGGTVGIVSLSWGSLRGNSKVRSGQVRSPVTVNLP